LWHCWDFWASPAVIPRYPQWFGVPIVIRRPGIVPLLPHSLHPWSPGQLFLSMALSPLAGYCKLLWYVRSLPAYCSIRRECIMGLSFILSDVFRSTIPYQYIPLFSSNIERLIKQVCLRGKQVPSIRVCKTTNITIKHKGRSFHGQA